MYLSHLVELLDKGGHQGGHALVDERLQERHGLLVRQVQHKLVLDLQHKGNGTYAHNWSLLHTSF